MRIVIFILASLSLCLTSTWVMANAVSNTPTTGTALGPLYPIVEPNLLVLLQNHARESAVDTQSRFHQVQEQIKNWSDHPIGRPLTVASQAHTQTQPVDNALKKRLPSNYRRDWLFIDTEDEEQIQLAKHFLRHCSSKERCRIIVTHGALAAARKLLNTPLWFDQGSKLTQKLNVTHVPALVTLTPEAITTHMAPTKHFSLKAWLAS